MAERNSDEVGQLRQTISRNKFTFVYFSKVERMNASNLKKELQNLLPVRAVLCCDFIGRSILEILSVEEHAVQVVAVLSGLGYKHEKDFDPLMGPKRSIDHVDSQEEMAKNAKAFLDRVQKMPARLKSYSVQQAYKELEEKAVLKPQAAEGFHPQAESPNQGSIESRDQ